MPTDFLDVSTRRTRPPAGTREKATTPSSFMKTTPSDFKTTPPKDVITIAPIDIKLPTLPSSETITSKMETPTVSDIMRTAFTDIVTSTSTFTEIKRTTELMRTPDVVMTSASDIQPKSTPLCNCSDATTITIATSATMETGGATLSPPEASSTAPSTDERDNTTYCKCGIPPPEWPEIEFPQRKFGIAKRVSLTSYSGTEFADLPHLPVLSH